MVIKSGPNKGKTVTVDFDMPRWNPHTDQFDDAWVTVILPRDGFEKAGDGRIGSCPLSELVIPSMQDFSKEKA